MRILSGLVAAVAAISMTQVAHGQTSGQNDGQDNTMNLDRSAANEQAMLAQELPQTLVVRVNDRTGEFEVFNSSSRLDKSAQHKVAKAKFTKMNAKSKMKGRGKSRHLAYSPLSWLLGFGLGGWSSPYYSYGNYNYNYNYYDSYSYNNGYSYYYYGSPYYGWGF